MFLAVSWHQTKLQPKTQLYKHTFFFSPLALSFKFVKKTPHFQQITLLHFTHIVVFGLISFNNLLWGGGVLLNIRLSSRPAVCALQSFDEHSPTDDRLAGVQPDAGRDAHKHRTNVFEHKYMEQRSRFGGIWLNVRTRNREYFAHVAVPLNHPVVKIVIFVVQTAEESQCR